MEIRHLTRKPIGWIVPFPTVKVVIFFFFFLYSSTVRVIQK